MQAHPVMLCIQDTTELDFNGQETEGLGPLNYEAMRGMYLHPTYAVTPDNGLLEYPHYGLDRLGRHWFVTNWSNESDGISGKVDRPSCRFFLAWVLLIADMIFATHIISDRLNSIRERARPVNRSYLKNTEVHMHIHQDRLLSNEFLEAEELLLSPNGRYTFVYQGDGNLVLYKFRPDGSRNWLWDSQTNRRPVGRCIMQGDGNLVIYGPTGDYVWDSGTDGKNDSWLVIQDDGNAVIYLPNGTPIWATNTVQPAMGKVSDEELKN